MTIKCEKCGADVVLPDDAKTATCEKCGAEVTVKAEEKAEETVEKKQLTPQEKARKVATLVVEILIILAALAFVPRIATRLHQHRMDSCGMPLSNEDSKQLMQFNQEGVENVVVPGCFSSIGEDAFANNAAIKSVTIPSTVKIIGNNAFSGCTALEEVKFAGGAGMYAVLDVVTGAAFKKNDAAMTIGNDAFNGCLNLKSFDIPVGFTSIGSDAFYGCKALASVTIPETVTAIEARAFAGCPALKKVVIPDSVKKVGSFVFSGSENLEEVSVPKHFTDKDIKNLAVNDKCKVVKR